MANRHVSRTSAYEDMQRGTPSIEATFRYKLLKSLFLSLASMMEFTTMHFREGGMCISEQNTIGTIALYARFAASAIDLKCEEECSISIVPQRIAQPVAKSRNSDTAKLRMNKEDPNHVYVMLHGERASSAGRVSQRVVHKLSLVGLDTDVIEIPDSSYECVVTMHAQQFQLQLPQMDGHELVYFKVTIPDDGDPRFTIFGNNELDASCIDQQFLRNADGNTGTEGVGPGANVSMDVTDPHFSNGSKMTTDAVDDAEMSEAAEASTETASEEHVETKVDTKAKRDTVYGPFKVSDLCIACGGCPLSTQVNIHLQENMPVAFMYTPEEGVVVYLVAPRIVDEDTL